MGDSIIRIEPDWNVKQGSGQPTDWLRSIRIEPDWNVKISYQNSIIFFIQLE